MHTNGRVVFLEKFSSLAAESFSLGYFGFLQHVVCFEVGDLVRVKAKEDANIHQNKVDVAANERTIIEPSILVSCGRHHFVRQVKVPVLHHVRRFALNVLSKSVHAVRVVRLVLTPVVFVL